MRFPTLSTLALGLLILLGPAAFAGPPAANQPSEIKVDTPAQEGIQVPKPPFSEGIFPCTSCHDGKSMKPNLKRRVLTDMHTDIILNHGPASRWCLDCHDANNRDSLHLASGEKVSFTASYLLCGQCHGDKLRDWRVGVHGKRTGNWNGLKQYLLCVNCHNPHSPRFKALKPMPAPTPPEQIKARKGGAR
ncbi:cytochrome c3 family protein [Geothrix fuzhouensis]|uniref:cytochrome c3 family protein n=1 Tax=Geothrix fuzhouensis TaxID=2966451 RepID=UPI0021475E99|nr:cytochrome c3 family protein [Geothrix fuzhouensis]